MRFLIGLMWLAAGFSLLHKGISLGSDWLAVAMILGLIKGRLLLAKSATRALLRIKMGLPPFPKSYFALVALMVSMGIGLSYLPWPMVRGFIDVVVGSALIRGGLVFFIGDRATLGRSPNIDTAAPQGSADTSGV